MRLFIPACGDRITLTAPWEFTLWLERRNIKFAQAHGLVGPGDPWKLAGYGRDVKNACHTLPAGTVLECDRVYIRTFNKSRLELNEDYDSITWKVMSPEGKPVRNQRFWVKLHDCLGIDYELGPSALYRDRIKAVRSVMEG